jgi:hypothetical protein
MAERWVNPYAPGAASMPPALTGRDELIAEFDGYLRAAEVELPARYLIVDGQRGMGKTVLLNALRTEARSRGWVAQRIEATGDTPFLASLAQEAGVRATPLRRTSSSRH